MISLRDQIKPRTSRREFLKSSTTAMVTWVVAPKQGTVPAPYAAAQGPSSNVAEKNGPIIIELAAGEYDRQNSPVFFQLPGSWRDQRGVVLERIETGELVDTQVALGPPPHLVWLIRDLLKAGQTRRYRLAPGFPVPPPNPTMTCNDGRGLMVKVADRPLLRYNQAIIPSPDPQQPFFERSGYAYPVFNPIGQTVTDDFPPDHMHQHSVWFAWSRATFEGRQVNFWELSERKGTIEHAKFEETGGERCSPTLPLCCATLTSPRLGGPYLRYMRLGSC